MMTARLRSLVALLVLGAGPLGAQPAPADSLRPTLVPQSGHGLVTSIAFGFDGAVLATASYDMTVRLWDVRTQTEIRRLSGHSGVVRSVAFSPDGQSMLTASSDATARLWDARTGTETVRLQGHDAAVYSGAFSPDGRRVVTASDDGTVRLWDAASGDEIRRVSVPEAGPFAPFRSVVFGSEGRLFAATQGGSVWIWEAESGDRVATLNGYGGTLTSVAFGPEGRRLATAGRGGTARVWDVSTRTTAHELQGHVGPVESVVFSPDAQLVATTGRDGSVRLWDTETGTAVQVLTQPDGPLSSVAFEPDGRSIVAAGRDGSVRTWDVATGRELPWVAEPTAGYHSVAWSPGERYLLTAKWGGAAQVWDLETEAAPYRLDGSVGWVGPLAFSPDGDLIVAPRRDGAVGIWSAASGAEIRMLEDRGGATSAAFSPDGRTIAVGGRDVVSLWDAASGALQHRLDEPGSAHSISFSPDGRYVTAGASNGVVRVWNVATGDAHRRLGVGFGGGGRPFVFDRGGRYLMQARSDSTALVWDLNTGRAVDRPEGAVQWGVGQHAFGPTGRRFATGGDAAAEVRDVATGGVVFRLDGHAGLTYPPAFSSSGRSLVSRGVDGTIRIWSAATGREVAALLALADGGWLVVTPDGRFDAPDLEAISGAVWVAPDDPFTPLPIEAFMADFYEPRLLSRVLAGETFPDMGSLLDRNRVQPRVEITGTAIVDRSASVTVEVEGMSREYGGEMYESGVWDLRLFRGGQLVAWADGALVDGTGKRTFTFDVALPTSVAQADTLGFSAYAFNADRVKSRTARATLARPASATPRRRRAFVVSLGVDAFADSTWDLAFAAADARATTAALQTTLEATHDYADVVTVALVSDASQTHGTAAALRGALRRLAGDPLDADAQTALGAVPGAGRLDQATPDDVVIVTLSTHGYTAPDGVFYLLPSDIPVTGGRLTPELLAAAVSSDDLAAWLRGVDAGALALVVDACNAAGAVEGTGFKPGPMGARGLGQLAFDKGMAVLTATQAAAPALESAETGRGLLTFALVDNGLLAGQADGTDGDVVDGRVTLAEWLAYGAARVPVLHAEVLAGKVETFGRGGIRARSLPPDVAVGAAGSAVRSGAQTPALFDFRRGGRQTVVAIDAP